jgi:hypothetical protein
MAGDQERKVRLSETCWNEVVDLARKHSEDWFVFKRDLELGIGRSEITGKLGFEILEGPEGEPVFFKSFHRVYRNREVYGRLGTVLFDGKARPAVLTGIVFDLELDPGLSLKDIDPEAIKLSLVGSMQEKNVWDLTAEDILPIILPRLPEEVGHGAQVCLIVDRGLMKMMKLSLS